MSKTWVSLLTIISGILLILGSPIYSYDFLLLVMFVPWFLFLSKNQSYKSALYSSLTITIMYSLSNYSWVPETIHNFFDYSFLKSLTISLTFIFITKITFIVYALVITKLNKLNLKNSMTKIVFISILYPALDYYLPSFFYDTLGHYTFNSPKISLISSIIGVYGITFIFILINWLLVYKKYVYTLATLIVIATFSYVKNQENPNKYNKIKVMTLQINVNKKDFKEQNKRYYKVIDNTISYIENNFNNEDIIVLPESFLPSDTESLQNSIYLKKIKDLSKKINSDILVGTNYQEGPNTFNSILHISDDNENYSFKEELFPLGEYLPFQFLTKFIFPLPSNISNTKNKVVLTVKDVNILPLICYESVANKKFNKYIKGSHLLINPTNEIWFGEKSKVLTEALSRFKSYESNQTMIRSSLNAPSGIYQAGYPAKTIYKKEIEISHISSNVKINKINSFYIDYKEVYDYIYLISILVFLIIVITSFIKRSI
jgi:apolipoprotein N-acyltransferase